MSSTDATFIGEEITTSFTLSARDIRAGAEFCRDKNPIHYQEKAAINAGFKTIIACGGHTSSLFAATLTHYFENKCALMGLENHFFYKKPVYADQLLTVQWQTTDMVTKNTLKGDIVTFQGEMFNANGEVVISGIVKVLFLTNQ